MRLLLIAIDEEIPPWKCSVQNFILREKKTTDLYKAVIKKRKLEAKLKREMIGILSEQKDERKIERLDRPVFFAYSLTHSFQTKNFHTQMWLLIWNRISWKNVIDMNRVMQVRVKEWYSVPVISLWFTNGKTSLCHHQHHRFFISTLILQLTFAFWTSVFPSEIIRILLLVCFMVKVFVEINWVARYAWKTDIRLQRSFSVSPMATRLSANVSLHYLSLKNNTYDFYIHINDAS